MPCCQDRCKWCYVVLCSVFIASGSFLNGYDVGASNGIKEMDGFRETFNLSRTPVDQDGNDTLTCSTDDSESTSAILGLVVSIFSFGSLVGGILGGPVSDYGGRRVALICGGVLYATGTVVQAASFFVWLLLLGKFWTGLGNGILTQVISLYIAEISPKHLRGKLVSLGPMAAAIGTLSASIVNVLVEEVWFGWRLTTSLQLVVACSFLFGSAIIPESPRWLVKKNKSNKALKTLKRIYKSDTVAQDCLNEISASYGKTVYKRAWEAFFSWTVVHRVFLGFSILFFSRANGMQLTVYFSVSIFCKVGIPGYLGGVIIGISLFSSLIIGLFITDRVGRKVILLCGYVAMTLCLTAAAVLIVVFGLEDESFSTEKSIAGYFVVLFIALFVGVNMASSISQSFIIVSEIFPLRIKGVAIALVTTGWWCGNIVSSEVSPFLLTSPLGTAGTLFLHAGICSLVFVFVLLLIPETKKLSLEQVDHLFTLPLLKRTNIVFYITCGRISSTKVIEMPSPSASEEGDPLEVPLDQLLNETEQDLDNECTIVDDLTLQGSVTSL